MAGSLYDHKQFVTPWKENIENDNRIWLVFNQVIKTSQNVWKKKEKKRNDSEQSCSFTWQVEETILSYSGSYLLIQLCTTTLQVFWKSVLYIHTASESERQILFWELGCIIIFTLHEIPSYRDPGAGARRPTARRSEAQLKPLNSRVSLSFSTVTCHLPCLVTKSEWSHVYKLHFGNSKMPNKSRVLVVVHY